MDTVKSESISKIKMKGKVRTDAKTKEISSEERTYELPQVGSSCPTACRFFQHRVCDQRVEVPISRDS